MRNIIALALFAGMLDPMVSTAQHEEGDPIAEHHEEIGPHQLGIMAGYAWVPAATDNDGNASGFLIPSFGLDYSYWFQHKFALRMVNDLELSSYVIEQEDGQLLERNFKYIGAIVGVWEPVKHLAVYAGPGYEIEAHENFVVIKIGAEAIKNFEDGWSAGLNLSIDFNEVYETVSSGLFIARRF